MKALRGDWGTCAQCKESFKEGEQSMPSTSHPGIYIDGDNKPRIHLGCGIAGNCYACAKQILTGEDPIEDTNESGLRCIYHQDCALDAKVMIAKRIKDVEASRARQQGLDKERAKRHAREGILEQQAQAHMLKGEHANIFVLTRHVAAERSASRARAVGAHMASSNPRVRAVSFDHLTGTMNFIVYDLSFLQGRNFDGQPAFVTYEVRERHPEAESFLKSRGFDPVYVEGEM